MHTRPNLIFGYDILKSGKFAVIHLQRRHCAEAGGPVCKLGEHYATSSLAHNIIIIAPQPLSFCVVAYVCGFHRMQTQPHMCTACDLREHRTIKCCMAKHVCAKLLHKELGAPLASDGTMSFRSHRQPASQPGGSA